MKSLSIFFLTCLTVCGGATPKPTPLKSALLRSRLFTTPAKNTGQGESSYQHRNTLLCDLIHLVFLFMKAF